MCRPGLPAWLSLFEDNAFASGLRQATQEAQVCTLLYFMGPEARPLFSTFGLDDKLSNYAAMVPRFMAHFIPLPTKEGAATG